MDSAKTAYDRLNTKQQAFVDAYVHKTKGNATKAAEEAGYKQAMQQGSRLRLNPLVAEAIEAGLKEQREQIRARGIAILENRVEALNTRWELLEEIRRERAADPSMQDVPGGKTGFLIRRSKLVKVYAPVQMGEAAAEEGEVCPYCVDRYDDADDAPRLRFRTTLHPQNGKERESLLCPECLDRWRDTDQLASARLSETVFEYETDGRLLSEIRELERQAASELGQWKERVEHTFLKKVAGELKGMSDDELLGFIAGDGEETAGAD